MPLIIVKCLLVVLMRQGLLRELQALIILDTHGQAALNLGRPEAKIMSLTVPQGNREGFHRRVPTETRAPLQGAWSVG